MNGLRHRRLLTGVVSLSLLSFPILLAQNRCVPDKNLAASGLRGDRAEPNWLTYRNPKDGLSFRYPVLLKNSTRSRPQGRNGDYTSK